MNMPCGKSREVPVAILRQLVRLDEETGRLYWRERGEEWFLHSKRPAASCAVWNAQHAGREAFATPGGKGYLVGDLFDIPYRANRVVFAMYYGRWPVGDVDHRDLDRTNNRPTNLREASRRQNMHNTNGRSDASSPFCGVSWCNNRRQWRSCCRDSGGKTRHLGYFTDEVGAAYAYDAFAREHHGEFARLNFPEAGGKSE